MYLIWSSPRQPSRDLPLTTREIADLLAGNIPDQGVKCDRLLALTVGGAQARADLVDHTTLLSGHIGSLAYLSEL
jgi:hypothetical protein